MKTFDELPTIFQEAIIELEPEVRPLVERIEAEPATTRNRYGAYMTALSQIVKDGDYGVLMLVALAMIKAGGNRQGISDGLRIIQG